MFKLNNQILFVTGLILILINLKSINAQKLKCNAATEKEMDGVVARIMTFGTDRAFPENKAQLKEYCKEHVRLINKLENYKTACLKNEAKNIVSVIIYSIKQVVQVYCKKPNSKRTAELLDSAGCANKATKDYNECSKGYIERLIYAKTIINKPKDRLIQTCCGYFHIYNCVREQALKHPDICTQERIEANINYIKTFFDNAINAACGEYNGDNDKCDRVEVPPPKKIKKALPKSFFGPLVSVLSNI